MARMLGKWSALVAIIGFLASGCDRSGSGTPEEPASQSSGTTVTDDGSLKVAPVDPTSVDAPVSMSLDTKMVYFAFDVDSVNPEDIKKLDEMAQYMRSEPQTSLEIAGHCDERGTGEYNLGLGNRRAESIKRYLESLGVDGSRITTVSFGKERPVVQGAMSESDHSMNRRAEFQLR